MKLHSKLGMEDGEKNIYKLSKIKRNENKRLYLCLVSYGLRLKGC